jgi:hypothetical protein
VEIEVEADGMLRRLGVWVNIRRSS